MDLKLQDKVAIITGGNKGFGAASAFELAREGSNLLITARNEVDLAETVKKIANEFSSKVETLSADLTTSGEAEKIAKAALTSYGRIDILINCAGASQGGVFWEIEDKVWEDSLALKFLGTIRMIRAVIPAMRKQSYGRIITVAGNTGKQPNARMLPGSAANAALLAVTVGLAQEVAADGIVLNAVNPGPSRTERWNTLMQNLSRQSGKSVEDVEAGIMADIPMNRLGAPEEIARLIAFLASDTAANMTGTSITADGGWTKALA
jgi:NAD(P)-dependent dehydrogenase (short-subunit alcohol dehydrogenase family)